MSDGGDEVEQVGDGFEGIVDLVGDGASEATDGGELLALDEGGLGLLLVRDLQDDGGDGLDVAFGVVDGRVADVPAAMFAGAARKLSFEDVVADGMTGGGLLKSSLMPLRGAISVMVRPMIWSLGRPMVSAWRVLTRM